MGILRGGTTVGEKWCPPTWRWATSRLCSPPTKHVLRGWYIVYGGTDTYAGRIPLGWRYTCLLGGHVTTTAVLIHQLGEHRPISGGTSCLDGDTLSWTIHICYTLVGWCYFLPGRYTPWLAVHLRVIHIFLRLPGRYTTWLVLHFIHWSFWAIHILFTDLKACLQISVHAFEKVYVTQWPFSSL